MAEEKVRPLHPATLAAQALGHWEPSTRGLVPAIYTATTYERAADGTYLSFGGVGPDQLTGDGKTWFEEYKASHNGDSPATYTAYGNASATVVLEALKKANTNDRWEVLKAIMATSGLATVVGDTSFDENGDTTNISLTGYQVEGSWPPAFKEILTAP